MGCRSDHRRASLENEQSCYQLADPGPFPDPMLRKLELVTKVAWKRELGQSGVGNGGNARGTWKIDDAHYGSLGGLGWFPRDRSLRRIQKYNLFWYFEYRINPTNKSKKTGLTHLQL